MPAGAQASLHPEAETCTGILTTPLIGPLGATSKSSGLLLRTSSKTRVPEISLPGPLPAPAALRGASWAESKQLRGQQAWHSCGCWLPRQSRQRNAQTHAVREPRGAQLQETEQNSLLAPSRPSRLQLLNPGACWLRRRQGPAPQESRVSFLAVWLWANHTPSLGQSPLLPAICGDCPAKSRSPGILWHAPFFWEDSHFSPLPPLALIQVGLGHVPWALQAPPLAALTVPEVS